MWQDKVFAICNVIFILSVAVQIVGNWAHRVCGVIPLTSFPTSAALFVMSYSLWTVDMRWGASATFTTAVLWAILLLQYYVYRREQDCADEDSDEGASAVLLQDLVLPTGVIVPTGERVMVLEDYGGAALVSPDLAPGETMIVSQLILGPREEVPAPRGQEDIGRLAVLKKDIDGLRSGTWVKVENSEDGVVTLSCATGIGTDDRKYMTFREYIDIVIPACEA